MQKWIILIPIIAISLVSIALISNFEINKSDNIIIPHESISTSNAIPIKIGTIHDDAVKIITRFQPTVDYISKKLSDEDVKYEGKVVVVETIDKMIKSLQEQKIDLYLESPLTAILISEKSGAVPFLHRWKEGTSYYHSVFFVKNESTITSLSDLSGKTIVFENPESTTGYLLPKAYLIQNGITFSTDTKNDLKYIFSRTDENTVRWVIAKKADIGAISSIDYEELSEITKSQIRIIDRTIDVPRHLVLHRSELNPDVSDDIKTILLNMHKDFEGAKILKEFKNTTKYTEIKNKQELINQVKEILELSNK